MAKDELVIGIDLGTTYSCVGVWRNGRVEIVPNDQGNRKTPSCVAFTDCERLIGEGANIQVGSNASNTVFDVKRLMGRSFYDESVESDAKYWPFEMIADEHDKKLKISVSYLGRKKEFSPEEISAMILLKMMETAEAYLGPGATIKHAVVSVPAYFNGWQRQATKDAGAIAGLKSMDIINEPSAAAIAYSLNRKWSHAEESTVLIYDLGGGTLDVTLVVIREGKLVQVKATAGDTHLGGEDFTNNMVEHFVNIFEKKNQRYIRGEKKAIRRLRRSCEEAKRKLSTVPNTTVVVDALFEGIDLHSGISRDLFEQLNVDLFEKCRQPIKACLAEAGLDKAMVDDVVLVGGCTRIPGVHQLVKDFFDGKQLCRNINADEAVAYGATVQAAMLVSHKRDIIINDITPFSQTINVVGELMSLVVPRNTTIPPMIAMGFTTTKDSVDITVQEGVSEMVKKFHLSGITIAPTSFTSIDVYFTNDQGGIQDVSARQISQRKINITKDAGRFSTGDIARMAQEAQDYKAVDEEHKKRAQIRNEIEDLLYTIGNTINKYQDTAAARMLVDQEEATGDQEMETPGNDTPQRWPSLMAKLNQARGKENKKKIQVESDPIKKLEKAADEATKWLENFDQRKTSEIIDMKRQIEGVFDSSIRQIKGVSP